MRGPTTCAQRLTEPSPATSGFGRFVEVLARDKHAGSETYDFVKEVTNQTQSVWERRD